MGIYFRIFTCFNLVSVYRYSFKGSVIVIRSVKHDCILTCISCYLILTFRSLFDYTDIS